MLLVACAVMAVFTFCSLGQVQTFEYTFNFISMGFFSEGQPTGGAHPDDIYTWYFFTVSLMSAILPLLAVFCFKNTKLQKNLCLISILFDVAAAVVGGYLGYCLIDGGTISWSTVIIAPLLSVVALIFAWRMISSDERKLRAVDRFRD